MVKKYAPIVLGLLGANVFIGLVLVVLGVLGCVRRGAKGAASASPLRAPHYVQVALKDEGDTDYHKPYATR